jgi:hypothetical protein
VYIGGTSQDDGTKLVKTSDIIPLTKGGTGATSASDARTNLGITSGTTLPSSGSDGQIFLQTGEGSYVDRIGAAPAGYGLGVKPTKVDWSTVNSLVLPGWYRFEQTNGITAGGVTVTYAHLRVDGYNENLSRQTLYPIGLSGNVLTRILVNGTWQEWEWENPPMAMNVEYRTTERLEGKPVYVKYINYGFYTGNTALEFAHDISSVYTPITIDIVNNLQEVLTDYQNLEYLTMNRTYIYMKCSNSMGNVGFIVKYSKNVT